MVTRRSPKEKPFPRRALPRELSEFAAQRRFMFAVTRPVAGDGSLNFDYEIKQMPSREALKALINREESKGNSRRNWEAIVKERVPRNMIVSRGYQREDRDWIIPDGLHGVALREYLAAGAFPHLTD